MRRACGEPAFECSRGFEQAVSRHGTEFDSFNYLISSEDLVEAIMRFGLSVRGGVHCILDMKTARELEVEHGSSTIAQRAAAGFSAGTEGVHRERSCDTGLVINLLREAGFTRTDAYDARGLTGVGSDTGRVQFVPRL